MRRKWRVARNESNATHVGSYYCCALSVHNTAWQYHHYDHPLERVLARVVLRRGKYEAEHITPALAELHWLPIKQRVTFKLFKIRYLHQPTYLLDLLNHYTPTCSLRSSSQLLLETNPTRTVLSQRGFSSSAPRVWNSLPDKLRSCSTLDTCWRTLKTHLFSIAFDA